MSLVSRYKLDGDVLDSVGSNDGTNYGATFGSGVFGQCANFVTNDYIDLGGSLVPCPRLTSWSLSFWMKLPLALPTGYLGIMSLKSETSNFIAVHSKSSSGYRFAFGYSGITNNLSYYLAILLMVPILLYSRRISNWF